MYTLLELESKTFGELKKIGYELNVFPEGDRRYRQSWIDAIVGVNPPLLQLLEVSPGVEVEQAQVAIIETVEASPAAEAEQVQELPIESKFGRIVYPNSAGGIELSHQIPYIHLADFELYPSSKAIKPVTETSPGVDLDDELPECNNCFGDGYVEDEFGCIKFCQCETEPRLSHQKTQRAIVPAAEKFPAVKCVYTNSR